MFRKVKVQPDLLTAHIEAGSSIVSHFQAAHDTLAASNEGLRAVIAEDRAVINDKNVRIGTAEEAVDKQSKLLTKLQDFVV